MGPFTLSAFLMDTDAVRKPQSSARSCCYRKRPIRATCRKPPVHFPLSCVPFSYPPSTDTSSRVGQIDNNPGLRDDSFHSEATSMNSSNSSNHSYTSLSVSRSESANTLVSYDPDIDHVYTERPVSVHSSEPSMDNPTSPVKRPKEIPAPRADSLPSDQALLNAFRFVDRKLAECYPGLKCGTTATTVWAGYNDASNSWDLKCGWVGDSKCVLMKDDRFGVMPLSINHHLDYQPERQRIIVSFACFACFADDEPMTPVPHHRTSVCQR